ncbi:MAG: helix-turn-helix transcriptional regulator [Flavobacteriaceae bacterium]
MKVHPFNIPKPAGERLVVQIDRSASFYNKLHQHEEIQISHIVSGEGKLVVADSVHQYKAGDTFVIGQYCPHVFLSARDSTPSHMISVFFTKTSFGDHFFEFPEMEALQGFFKRSQAGFKVDDSLKVPELMHQLAGAKKLSKFLLFLQLLNSLSAAPHQVLTTYVYPKKISVNEGNRMSTVIDFVMNNFQQEISLKTVAEIAYMTPNAFCRFFKLRTNKTFFQFLIELRIAHACSMLGDNSPLPISEIAIASGFKSISNFNRKFKQTTGLSPSEYFKSLVVQTA